MQLEGHENEEALFLRANIGKASDTYSIFGEGLMWVKPHMAPPRAYDGVGWNNGW